MLQDSLPAIFRLEHGHLMMSNLMHPIFCFGISCYHSKNGITSYAFPPKRSDLSLLILEQLEAIDARGIEHPLEVGRERRSRLKVSEGPQNVIDPGEEVFKRTPLTSQ